MDDALFRFLATSIMERWIQTCPHELRDRTLIWNQRHLPHALRQFETHQHVA
ncbi:hypothetical protein [Streptomyces sp. NPDC049040]|uniref:hypothetical protein n=1 Tax=Streptomyces sp. NPDC049040 TaxID=3365593 RepID=UPI00371623FB